MTEKLKEKVAIVTGASKGIGASIAKHLAAEGASVVINYANSKKDAEQVVSEITKKGGKAIAIQANVADQNEIKRLFAETLKAFGKLDILINNAGIYQFVDLEHVTPEIFHKMFDLNVLGVMLATQEAVRHFGPSGGNIVNISSIVSATAPPLSSIYSATKAAVDAVTKSLAKELGGRKIRINSVNPGLVETEGVRSGGYSEGDFRKDVELKTPLGRIGQPADIAPAVVFLVSEDSGWITGESFFISGGLK